MAPKKRKLPTGSTRARTQRVIERDVLPEVLPDLKAKRVAADDVCGACLLPVEGNEQLGMVDNCHHIFHFECAERWSRTENSCPQCKQRFFWLAAYSAKGKRESLTRVERRDQEGDDDEDYEDFQVCEKCKQVGDESTLLLCDGMNGTCNAAYHMGCVGLSSVPRDSWYCPDCTERGYDTDARGMRQRCGSSATGADADVAWEATAATASASAAARPPEPSPRRPLEVSTSPAAAAASSASSSSSSSPAQLAVTSPAPASASVAAAAQAISAAAATALRGRGRGRGRGGAGVGLPSQLRLSALACVSPAVDVPAFRPPGGGAAGGAHAGAAGAGVFASFVQRRRAAKAAASAASGAAGGVAGGASFIKLNPTYEQDFMGGGGSG